jgi:hypothetical protein
VRAHHDAREREHRGDDEQRAAQRAVVEPDPEREREPPGGVIAREREVLRARDQQVRVARMGDVGAHPRDGMRERLADEQRERRGGRAEHCARAPSRPAHQEGERDQHHQDAGEIPGEQAEQPV